MNKQENIVIPGMLCSLRGNRERSEIAAILKISENALKSYEDGLRVPRDEVKDRIAGLYGISRCELFK